MPIAKGNDLLTLPACSTLFGPRGVPGGWCRGPNAVFSSAQATVKVLGHSPFHDTDLTASGMLSYLGGSWDRDIAFAGYSIPLQVCTHAQKIAHVVANGATCSAAMRMQVVCGGQFCLMYSHAFSLYLQGDIPALQMIESIPGVDPERRKKLMHVLDIDPAWRMHRVSDGQRRRVQICLGLLKPPEV